MLWQLALSRLLSLAMGKSQGRYKELYSCDIDDIEQGMDYAEQLLDAAAHRGSGGVYRRYYLRRADYFIQDHIDGLMYLHQQGLQDKFIALPYVVSTTDVYLAASCFSPCVPLAPQINNIIIQLKQDGSLQRIIDTYMPQARYKPQ